MGFDEQQLLVQLSHRNLIDRKGFILCHHSPVNANVLLSLFNAFNSKTFSHLSTSRGVVYIGVEVPQIQCFWTL